MTFQLKFGYVGGANGIGAATVTRFYFSGAHVFFSDWDEKNGLALEKSLLSDTKGESGTCCFMKVNVKEYQAQLLQFDTAYKMHGRIDIAIYCAGITEDPGWIISQDANLKSIREVIIPITAPTLLSSQF
jgi:NAD(P)-dependent dehydrogenase (short-subunit alcohol dehydrogenase family)